MNQDLNISPSQAYLVTGLFTFGAKPGILQCVNGVVTFRNELNVSLLEVNVSDIASATNKATGWLFLTFQNGKKYKIAFSDPRPFSMKHEKTSVEKFGPLSGSMGTSIEIITSASDGDVVAKRWITELSKFGVQS